MTLELPPQREGQARTMTICDGPGSLPAETGHWYSPDAVRALIKKERESCAKLCEAINLEYQIEAEKGKLKGIRWNRNMWKSRAAGECELAIRKRSNGGGNGRAGIIGTSR